MQVEKEERERERKKKKPSPFDTHKQVVTLKHS